MAITANEGGVLYKLENLNANENGTIYELDTVYANENGTLHEIHSAWTIPVLGEWNTAKSTASSELIDDTYYVNCYGAAAANFSVTSKTKATITLTNYSRDTVYSSGAHIQSGSLGRILYVSGTGAYSWRAQTGQNDYTTWENFVSEYVLEKGDYFVGCASDTGSGSGTIKFTIKFEKA